MTPVTSYTAVSIYENGWGGAETGGSRQPTYPHFFLLGFRPLYFENAQKYILKNEQKK